MPAPGQSAQPARPLIIAGPTASGKTGASLLAVDHLARLGIRGEIVGCDSVQLYRGFDIGSAKPTAAERARAPHHLIDVVTWRDEYDAARYATDARAAIDDIRSRGAVPIVVGGTGLYLRALRGESWDDDLPSDDSLRESLRLRATADLWDELQRVDPERARALHPNDRFRVIRAIELARLSGLPASARSRSPQGTPTPTPTPLDDAFVVVLDPARAILHDRINRRVDGMLDEGLIAETRRLLDEGCPPSAKPMRSIGYRQAAEHLRGEIPLDQLPGLIAAATRQYAKRQCTWWKKVGRDATPTSLQAFAESLRAWTTPLAPHGNQNTN